MPSGLRGPHARTLALQYFDAARHFDAVQLLPGRGVRVRLQPTPFSPTYLVQIDYRPVGKPTIWLLSPKPSSRPRHTYGDGSLCVYWHEWNNTMGFGTALIPWIAEWLYFYEIWLATGTWEAPESTHEGPKA